MVVRDASNGTDYVAEVDRDGDMVWGSVGVSENIIDASWKAVVDGLVVGLLRLTEA